MSENIGKFASLPQQQQQAEEQKQHHGGDGEEQKEHKARSVDATVLLLLERLRAVGDECS